MKFVFITGATGFIGKRITDKFVGEGWHVIVLIHRTPSAILNSFAEKKLVTCIYGDIEHSRSFEGQLINIIVKNNIRLSAIIHCAAYVSDVGRRQQFMKINYEATIAIAELAKKLNTRMVFISTTDVYGIKDFNGETEEQLPFCNNRDNSYPRFKIAAEQWLKTNYPTNNLVIIRPAAVWGLNDHTLTKRIIDFLKWSPFIIHFGKWKGRNRWPLAHVKNVALAAYIATTATSAAGKVINVLDNEKISIDDFYTKLALIFFPNKKFTRIFIPIELMLPLSWIITIISNIFNLKKPFIDPSNYALFSVSSNLDFSNNLFVSLAKKCNQKITSYTEGIEELIRHSSTIEE